MSANKFLDKNYQAVLATIKLIGRQFASSFGADLKIPASYKSVKNVILCGMGGSALGAHIFKALNISSVPFCFYHGYLPPRFLNKDSLFIASSYSGNTEEVLSSLEEAMKRGAKIFGIANGGKLLSILQKKKYPFICFDAKYNPSGEPRYGLGYSLGALFNLFRALGFLEAKIEEIKKAFSGELKLPFGEAEKMAGELKGFSPMIVSGNFLEGNAHTFVNQLNETCKVFAEFHSLPELNHHLMEGLSRPAALRKHLKFIFLESDLDDQKIRARNEITKKVVAKNKISYTLYRVSGANKFKQVMNLLIFSSLVSLNLAVVYGEDPLAIPWVDYFKKELSRLNF